MRITSTLGNDREQLVIDSGSRENDRGTLICFHSRDYFHLVDCVCVYVLEGLIGDVPFMKSGVFSGMVHHRPYNSRHRIPVHLYAFTVINTHVCSSKWSFLTNRRIRHPPQARLVRGTSRAIVGADDLYVRPLMSQQSEFADSVYHRVRLGPVDVASLVGEISARWGAGHSIGSVHLFVVEAIYCLLPRGDIDVGEIKEGRFVSWDIDPMDAFDRIDSGLTPRSLAFADHGKFVFKVKMPNQSSEPTSASGTSPAGQEPRLP